MMEDHSIITASSPPSENDADGKPLWASMYRPTYTTAEMRSFREDDEDQLHHDEDEREISREDIQNSIRKFERLSKQLEERTSPLVRDDLLMERRFSLDSEGDNDMYRNPLSFSYSDLATDKQESEEERSKSDGETEDLIQREEDTIFQEEERSKSDGEQEEDDDDAVPLKIQQVAANKAKKLLLSNCWLKTVPSEVWDLTHITELDLSANYLKKVSKSVGMLTHLKKLRLNHNQLSILPKEVWGLTKLTVLLLNNNALKAIPKDIRNLTKLKTLDLSSNQINEISTKDGLISLTSLIELRLRNNALTSIPIAVAESMTSLQVLWLEGNPLSSIPKSIIKKPASTILSYIKDHPNARKSGKPAEPIKLRTFRKSPPPVVPGKSALPHGKKDMHVIAEKELKKRKREQLEEMRKHMEVEKKVKLLEHELMLANAKAQKFEEEVRKVEEQKSLDPVVPPSASPQQGSNPTQQIPPSITSLTTLAPTPLNFAQLPPHVPRQMAVVNKQNGTTTEKNGANNFEWEIPMSELTLGPRIGRGGYGEVFRGVWSGTEVAIKMLFTDNMSAKLITDLRNEVELLCKLRHPNIVLFMGACTEPETPCIVTEYLGRGSLANILQDESIEVDWGLRLQIGIDCARGMSYLHSRHPVIIHRDLKTDNLLVDDNWQVKVADFGLATVKLRTFAKTMCGTTGWVAPEVLAEEGYTEKADVYSFAIILWEMLTRQVPYAGKNTMQVVRSVDRGERLAIPDTCPPAYAQLITDCWAADPAARPSFSVVLRRMEEMRTKYQQEKLNQVKAEPMSIDNTNSNSNNNNNHINNDNNNHINNNHISNNHTNNNSNNKNHIDNHNTNNNSNNNTNFISSVDALHGPTITFVHHAGAKPMSVDNVQTHNTTNNNITHVGDKDNNT